MTAEIVLMNKDAIAIAADSAVTLTIGHDREKIFSSTHKIFTLSKYHPIGIMIYNDANFMGFPWETIIKDFRKKLGEEACDKVEDYADRFIKFLKNKKEFYDKNAEELYVQHKVYGYFLSIKEIILNTLDYHLEDERNITSEMINTFSAEICTDVINDHYNVWKNSKIIQTVPNNQGKYLNDNYSDLITVLKEKTFVNINLSEDNWNKLTSIARFLFTRYPKYLFTKHDLFFHSITSGVVITGFGKEELFPSLKSFSIDGIFNGHLMYRVDDELKVDFHHEAWIVPFAQKDMVYSFMEGIIPKYQIFIDNTLPHLLKKFQNAFIDICSDDFSEDKKMLLQSKFSNLSNELLTEYRTVLNRYRNETFVEKVTTIVSHLPKVELALMAKTFVNLTSFKRKVSMESETVSEPIDVAIISKGDGFIWIERKHYFKSELNPQFFKNYYKKMEL
ncbi:MAG: hypothetical protein ACOX08_00020 [Methanobacterium sp.]|jgi:hypothetical protein